MGYQPAGGYDPSVWDPESGGTLPIQRTSPAGTSSGSPVDSLIQKYVGDIQNYEGMGVLDRIGGGASARRRAMETLPTLMSVQAGQIRPEQLQKEYLGLIVNAASGIAKLDPDTQGTMIKMLGPTFMKLNQLAGLDIPKDFLLTAFTQPGAAENFAAVHLKSQAWSDNERQQIVAGAQGLRGPQLKGYYDDVVKKKQDEMAALIKPELPEFVAKVRRGMKDPGAPLTVADFIAQAAKVDQSFRDPMLAQVLDKVLSDDGYVAQLGLVPKAASLKTAEAVAAGPQLGELVRTKLAGMGVDVRTLDVKNPKDAALIQIAEQAVEKQKTDTAIQTGVGQVKAKFDLEQTEPLSAKDRATLIDPAALEKDLSMIQPPAGMSRGEANAKFVAVDDKQRDKVSGLKKANEIVGQLDSLSRQIITAKTPEEAFGQRGQAVEAFFKTNPLAATYRDLKQGFLGNLSRELGGERGVLTNQDIQRMADALPYFGDTEATRDLKLAAINDILGAAKTATVGEISGKRVEARSQIAEALKRLETANRMAQPKRAGAPTRVR